MWRLRWGWHQIRPIGCDCDKIDFNNDDEHNVNISNCFMLLFIWGLFAITLRWTSYLLLSQTCGREEIRMIYIV
jgi:hypothetical protein